MAAVSLKGIFREFLLIVTAGVVIVGILNGWDKLKAKHQAVVASQKTSVTIGQTMTIASVIPTNSSISLVLITSPTCPYCRLNMPFHRTLLDEARKNGVPIFVAVPSRADARNYLNELSLRDSELKEWKDLSLGAIGTPTLVAIDQQGVVKATWVGVVTGSDEGSVLKLVHEKSLASTLDTSIMSTPNYSEQEMVKLSQTRQLTIIDVHERDYPKHYPNAVILPIQELPYRAVHELNKNNTQVVSCSDLAPDQCQRAVSELLSAGFKVATLNAGIYRFSCKAQQVAG